MISNLIGALGDGHLVTELLVAQQDFDGWIATLKPEYYKAFPGLDPSKMISRDSTSKTVAQTTGAIKSGAINK